jgi:hypothetical protein
MSFGATAKDMCDKSHRYYIVLQSKTLEDDSPMSYHSSTGLHQWFSENRDK